jgi:tRNA dimethylallyltransferase
MGHKSVDILMGPTASGKSAMALEIAGRHPSVIINADAMQMYADLHILTARPDDAELQAAPHALYGAWDGAEHGTAARWVADAAAAIRAAWAQGKRPLLVGGTGMYIRALREGLSAIPAVAGPVRAELMALHQAEGTEALHALLLAEDPVMEARLKPGDTQRIMRALEVVRATGQSLATWQETKGTPPLPEAEFRLFTLMPERAQLYAQIDRRFLQMMERGVVAEVERLLARDLPAGSPILKAHGVPEIAAMLCGDMPREAAIARAQQNTRNYAKRQMTWIRQQCADARPAIDLVRGGL